MKFAKIFKIDKVIRRTLRRVYELKDLNETSTDDQFYQEDLTPVRVTKQTTNKTFKILNTRVRRGNRDYLVKWRGYSTEFEVGTGG
jgi:hypothetical protein